MKTYIALLRGINVGGHRKIKMADLKVAMTKWGFLDVVTYIQSGNIVFKADLKDLKKIEAEIEICIQDRFGFDVPVLIRKRDELVSILDKSPFKNLEDLEENKVYYTLFKEQPNIDTATRFDQSQYPNELFVIHEKCMYLNCTKGAGKAKLNNSIIEKKLKISATTRNHRTLLKLIELSS